MRVFEANDKFVHLLDQAVKLAQPQAPAGVPMESVPAFAQWQFLGYVLDGPGAHRVNRLWRDGTGKIVMLPEWDWKASGGGVAYFSEYLSERVRGTPAMSSGCSNRIAEIAAHRQTVLSYANSIGN